MLSNHYPLAWSSRYAVAIIGLIVIAGAVIRHFFNSQHAGKGSPWWTWAVAALCIWAAIWLSIIGKPGYANLADAPAAATPAAVTASFDEAVLAIQSRCSMCHAAEPVWEGIAIAPKGVRLDTPEEIARHAEIDPHPERAHPCHAAEQHHRDDPGRAQGRGNLAGGHGTPPPASDPAS